MDTTLRNLLNILLATLLISTSGVLGKYIAMPTEVIVWFRSAFAMVFLLVFCKYRKIRLSVHSKKTQMALVISSLFMAAHWVSYFYALKLSNVALGMLSLYTFPVITTLLEPFFSRTKFNPVHLLLAGIVLTGVSILTPKFDVESDDVKGILIGVFSALCYSIRILILKQHVKGYHGSMMMFYQTLVITVLLLPVLFFMDLSGLPSQFPYLLFLALVTTAVGHSLIIHSLKFFSAATTTIISSVQPIFGIVIAFIFVNEIPSINTLFGGLLIISSVLVEAFQLKK